MGRPKRDLTIKLLVNQVEHDALTKAATKEKVTLSDFIRSRLIRTTSTIEVLPNPWSATK